MNYSALSKPASLSLLAGLSLITHVNAEVELVAWWPLDAVAGSTTPDQSGNDYHMEMVNMDATNIVTGKFGGAMTFDGFEEMLTFVADIDGAQQLPITQHEAFSIALWVKGGFDTQEGGGDRRVFSEGSDSSGSPLFNIGTHNGGADPTVDLYLRDIDGGSPNHEHSFADGFDDEWHHITVVRDSDNDELLLYVDGVLDDQFFTFQDSFAEDVSNTVSIGGILRADPSHWFTGLIDEVALFSSVLSEDEVTQLFNGTLLTGENPDKDDDGLLDSWEALYEVDDPAADPDEDSLTNLAEFNARTNPVKADTDEDGLNDNIETNTGTFVGPEDTGTDPLNSDTDGDTLTDNVETGTGTFVSATDTGTNPLLKDTDSDSYDDNREIMASSDPTDANSVPAEQTVLIAYWPLDTIEGETTPDLSGNGLDLDVVNMTGDNVVAGKVGNAMLFSNADQTMLTKVSEEGDLLPISQYEQYTVSLWVNSSFEDQAANDLRVFSESSDSSNDPLLNIGTHNGGADGSVDIYLRNGGSPNHQHSFAEGFDGSWHHIAWVRDNETYSLYVDGELDDTEWTFWDPYSPGTTNITTVGGILRAVPSHWIDGMIDEVSLWQGALSEDSIAELASGEPLGGGGTIFQIVGIERNDADDVTVTWTSSAGKVYAFDQSENLELWQEAEDGIESDGDETSLTLPVPAGVQYFRIREQ